MGSHAPLSLIEAVYSHPNFRHRYANGWELILTYQQHFILRPIDRRSGYMQYLKLT
jgi:hypothetical protein